MRKIFIKILISFSITFFIFSCHSEKIMTAKIRIKGSDTMFPLTQILAEEYMKQNPYISVYVEGGGTALGVKALVRGEIDICTASRNLTSEEAKIMAENFGTLGLSFLIAKDGLSIYLNSKNNIWSLTIEDLKKIFTCEITNWKKLGGDDAKIVIYTRSPNSGTYLYFQEHILEGKEYCNEAKVISTTKEIINKVSNEKYAIGYGGIGYDGKVNHAKINGIEPTEENVLNDKYPIARYLYFYTLNTPSGFVKDFIDWVLSPEGQKIVREEGYIPLWERKF